MHSQTPYDRASKLADLKINKLVTSRKTNNRKTARPNSSQVPLSKQLVEPLDKQLMKELKQHGNVTHKMLFGFHSVFVDCYVVLKKSGNDWYVRRDLACPIFSALDSHCLSRIVGGDYRASGFMLITEAVLETLSLESVIRDGINQAKKSHIEYNPPSPRVLSEIPQLQSSHRRMLKQIGISTIEAFEEATVPQIVEQIVKQNIGVEQYRLEALKTIVGAKHGQSYRFCADNSAEVTYIKFLMECYTQEPCQEAGE